jgi:hypothetical protein
MAGLVIPLLLTLVACQPVATSNFKSNQMPVNQFYDAFNTKNLSLLDQALTDNWEDIPRAAGQSPG